MSPAPVRPGHGASPYRVGRGRCAGVVRCAGVARRGAGRRPAAAEHPTGPRPGDPHPAGGRAAGIQTAAGPGAPAPRAAARTALLGRRRARPAPLVLTPAPAGVVATVRRPRQDTDEVIVRCPRSVGVSPGPDPRAPGAPVGETKGISPEGGRARVARNAYEYRGGDGRPAAGVRTADVGPPVAAHRPGRPGSGKPPR